MNFKGKQLREDNMKKSFEITSICKEDIIQAFHNSDREILESIKQIVAEMDDSDMKKLAGKMADDYCEQLFWDSLRIIFQGVVKLVQSKRQ